MDMQLSSPSEHRLLTAVAMVVISVICLGMSGYSSETKPRIADSVAVGSPAWIAALPISSN